MLRLLRFWAELGFSDPAAVLSSPLSTGMSVAEAGRLGGMARNGRRNGQAI